MSGGYTKRRLAEAWWPSCDAENSGQHIFDHMNGEILDRWFVVPRLPGQPEGVFNFKGLSVGAQVQILQLTIL